MSPPILLVGSALLYWGQLNDLLLLSILMAAALEFRSILNWRRASSDKDFYTVGDLCTVLFVIISAIAFFSNQQRLFIYQIVAWLPFAFYPLLLLEAYSDRDKTPLGALVYQYRKKRDSSDRVISLGYLYFFLCLLAASVTIQRTEWFYAVVLVLLGWALWSLKPRSTPPIRWGVIFVLTGSIGFVLAIGLFKLHRIVEEYSLDFIESLFDTQRDPYQTTTAMGKIGKLKLSGKILMRIQISNNTLLAPSQPFLLQEASYNVYYENAWFNRQVGFESIKTIDVENAWPLAEAPAHNKRANFRLIMQKGKSRGLLALPANATKIMSDADISLSRNELGAVQFRANPILEEYELTLNHDAQFPSTVSAADLLVPTDLRGYITRLTDNLHLDSKKQGLQAQENAISAIRRFFISKFSYTTYLRQSLIRKNALVNFFERGTGHCEYFASATVMLLRSAGIPARYNVGYSVQEFDAEEQVYIVRARHRHAWATAYLANKWITVDTTPDRWLLADQETAPLFEPISDWISGIQYRIRIWQKQNTDETFTVYYLATAILLLLIFLLRLKGENLWAKPETIDKTNVDSRHQSTHFDQIRRIHAILRSQGIIWHAHEPLLAWKLRYLKDKTNPSLEKELDNIIQLYYQLCYEPVQHSQKLTIELEKKVDGWLKQYGALNSVNNASLL